MAAKPLRAAEQMFHLRMFLMNDVSDSQFYSLDRHETLLFK